MDNEQVQTWAGPATSKADLIIAHLPELARAKVIVALITPNDQVIEALAEAKTDVRPPLPPVENAMPALFEMLGGVIGLAVDDYIENGDGTNPMVETAAKVWHTLNDAYTKYVDPNGLPKA